MKRMKKPLRAVLCLVLLLVLLAAGYVVYVFSAYYRVPDDQALSVEDSTALSVQTGARYRAVSWNIGFGAYEADYSFFMDGGTQSRAWSEERLAANLTEIAALLKEQQADLYLLQEVDADGTRSYHIDERAPLLTALGAPQYGHIFAQNYDSPYLLYPLTQPHGANRSGIMTLSRFAMERALRRSLPVEQGVMKLVDLDRCYSVSYLPVSGGRTLALYNLHLSAYTSDGTIAVEQLDMLLADMQGEYEKGNYCIAGGDFNKDLLGDSSVWFGAVDKAYNWAQPIPADTFEGYNISLVAPLDETAPVPSCRNADAPYHEGQYVLTVDGFLVSDNVEALDGRVIDTRFAYSDHNPVYLDFSLKP